MNFNLVHSVQDISNESGPAAEPVTLQEIKNYLRLEGFVGGGSSGLSMQEPLSLSFTTGVFVQDALLQQDGVVPVQVSREGLVYSRTTDAPGNRQYNFDGSTGTITFQNESNGSETVDVSYGIEGEAGTTDEFDFDDDELEDMIVSGRQWCEARTGCSLVTKRIQAVITNLCGRTTLPAGPVTGTITGINSDGDDLEDIVTVGSVFPELKSHKYADMVFTYDAGYTPTTIPKGLKNAVKSFVAALYENRGDADKADFSTAARLCAPFVKYGAYA